jgi:ricin-type beta-trefoil lectin protein
MSRVMCAVSAFLFASLAGSSWAAGLIKDGVYTVTSVFNKGECLDIGAENVNKTEDNIQRFNCNGSVFQKWKFTADPKRPDRYLIQWSGEGDKRLTVENLRQNGNFLKFAPDQDSAFQSWFIDDSGTGQYEISSDGSGRCIDYWSDSPGARADLHLKACSGAAQQKWRIE